MSVMAPPVMPSWSMLSRRKRRPKQHSGSCKMVLKSSRVSTTCWAAILMAMCSGVLDQISIIFATGCLASRYAVLPFLEDQVRMAALLILELWLNERGGVEAHEDHEAVEVVRGFLQTNQHRLIRQACSSYSDETNSGSRWNTPAKRIGFFLEDDDLFAIFPQTRRNKRVRVWTQGKLLNALPTVR